MATEEQSRPGPGEDYNPGPPVTPRQAASVIVLRGAERGLEVLLVQRTPKARFMGGVWVFPGGAVDAQEGDGDEAHRAAAIRELREEAAIDVPDPASLIKFSRWITPKEVQIRFDTHFFLAEMPAGQEPRIDGEECVDLGWFTPAQALEAYEARRSRSCSRRSSTSSSSGSSPPSQTCSPTPEGARCSRSSPASSSKARSPGSCFPATPATNSRLLRPPAAR